MKIRYDFVEIQNTNQISNFHPFCRSLFQISYKSISICTAICWHILPSKHKKHALSELLIVIFFTILLQYHLICKMVLQQACINFLLIYSLSFISCLPLCLSVSHISLSHFSSSLSVAVQPQSHFVSPSPSCLSFSHFSSSLSVAMQPKTSLVCLRSAWWWGGWRG